MPGSQYFPPAPVTNNTPAPIMNMNPSNAFIAANQAEMLASNASDNDTCFRSDTNAVYTLIDQPANILANWKVHPVPAATTPVPAPVSSNTAPASPVANQMWTNSSTATVAGVPAGGTAVWSGSAWVVLEKTTRPWVRQESLMTGGKDATWANPFFKWSAPFQIANHGLNASSGSASLMYQIDFPPVGTVVTGLGGQSNTTVASTGIYLGGGFSTLYYKVPNAQNTSASVAGNFYRVGVSSTNFVVPDDFVMIATYNILDNELRLGTGKFLGGTPAAPVYAPYTCAKTNFAQGSNQLGGGAMVNIRNDVTQASSFGTWAGGVFTFNAAGTYRISFSATLGINSSAASVHSYVLWGYKNATSIMESSATVTGQNTSVTLAKSIPVSFVSGDTFSMKGATSAAAGYLNGGLSNGGGSQDMSEVFIEKIA